MTPWSVLDGNDSAKEEEDDGEVGESLFREAAEGRDDDPDVRTCRKAESYWRYSFHFFATGHDIPK